MRLIIGLFCCLGASLVLKTVDAGHYDTSYIQAPCDKSGNREINPGANGYQRYGFIGADSDGCYDPNSDCSIRLSVSSGNLITLRFQWIAIENSDILYISDSAQTHRIKGDITPPYSINSTSNWMNLQLITNADNGNCLGGFRLYYTSFHYGECSENEFRCSLDGRCIPNEVVCDYYDNCGDWSDESSATCPGLSTSTVTAVTSPVTVNSTYDHSYIQAPCADIGNRNFTLGANGYKRYGHIEADIDGCYNPYSDCYIRLSVGLGYYITTTFDWIAIDYSDVLLITEATKGHSINGYTTPPKSIYSTSNWMNLQFHTTSSSQCLGGFSLHYTSFHYGECSENEFRCSLDGRCIPNEVVCDSYDNCGDWSDEWTGTCGGGLSTTTVTSVTPTESVNPTYDYSYIQAPCDNSRNFTLGANGYKRYGYIEADDDGCYNPHSNCRIRLSVSPGYYITTTFDWIAIDYSDVLIVKEEAYEHLLNGYNTPQYSIYSTSNWMNLEFVTSSYYTCLRGFRLYYTSFHYGECSENEFRCSIHGRCIPNEVKCDSYDNCGDWSDEWAVTCGGLTTGAIVAISVTCALVGIALFAFLIHCINRRKQRHSSSSSSSSSSSESVERRRSNPERNATEPLGFVEPIGPPKYIYAPPAYSNINSIYEDPDQIHPPPYQSTFTTTPYGSNNNESLTCDNDNTPHRLHNHEDNSNSNIADRSNSNIANHF